MTMNKNAASPARRAACVALACGLACAGTAPLSAPAQALAVESTSSSAWQTDASPSTIKIQWERDYDAIEYVVTAKIYGHVEGTNPTLTFNVPMSSQSYTIEGLASSTAYSISVYAVHKADNFDVTKETETVQLAGLVAETDPVQVTGVKIAKWYNNTTTVSASWDAQRDCDGYEYRFVRVSDDQVAANGTTSTNSVKASLSTSAIYRLYVRAYNTDTFAAAGQDHVTTYGEWSEASVALCQPKIVKKKTCVTGAKRLKVTWKPISGADNYKVYVSTKKKSGYKLAAEVSGAKTTATVKKHKGKAFAAGKAYYVFVVVSRNEEDQAFLSGKTYAYSVKTGKTIWVF